MATPQPGVFALGTRSHHHLLLDVDPAASSDGLLSALAEVRASTTTVQGVNLVVGLGADLCAKVLPEALPADLAPFAALSGPPGEDAVVMPADQHDLWMWFHGSSPDALFDAVRSAVGRLEGFATVVGEQPSFTYQASRDLTGFEDGTENPPLHEAVEAATVPAGEPGAGGSVVLVQRWVHDLDGFDELDHDDQCQVFGRDKETSEELPDEVRSPRSHISRVVVEDADGEELEVFRRSTAFGGVLEHGLMFVAFSADVARLDLMLHRMVGTEDGITDRLTEFSRSTGAGWYVAPSLEAFSSS